MTLGITGFVWLVLYLALLLFVIIFANKKSKSDEQTSLLSKRQEFYNAKSSPLGNFALIFTFAATLFSAFFMVGLPGFLYTHGLGTWPYVIFGDVLGMLGLFYVGRRILLIRTKETLSPLEIILPTTFSKILFVVVTTVFILPYLAVQISGFGRLINAASDGAISVFVAAASGLAIMYMYSAYIGIRGIVLTDTIQGVVLFLCACLIGGYITFFQFDGPSDLLLTVYSKTPDLLGSPGPKGFFTFGALISGCILFASIPMSQPQFLTRYLIINPKNDLKYLRTIAIGFGVLLAVASLAILPIGLGGAVLYPNLESGDALIGTILSNFDSTAGRWISGLFVVGVLAAAMSTVDSILFSLGQFFAIDIYGKLVNKQVDEFNTIFTGRIFIFGVAVIALFLGVSNSNLIVYLSSLSFQGTLQLVPAVIGGLWKIPVKSHYTASISILVGVTFLFIFQYINPLSDLNLSPAIPAFILSSLVYLVSWTLHKRS